MPYPEVIGLWDVTLQGSLTDYPDVPPASVMFQVRITCHVCSAALVEFPSDITLFMGESKAITLEAVEPHSSDIAFELKLSDSSFNDAVVLNNEALSPA